LGYLLGIKNLAYKHGKNYAISGISVKRWLILNNLFYLKLVI
jgi:hypothetical protein